MSAQKQNKKHQINLLPKEDFEKTTLGRILKWALSTFRFIVILVEFVVIGGFLSRFWLDVRIGDLDDEIKQKSSLIASRQFFEDEFRGIQNKLSIISDINAQENSTLPFLEEISQNMPAGTRLDSFTKTDGEFEIRGSSFDEGSISQFLTDLQSNDLFIDANLSRMEANAGDELITFVIVGTIRQGEQ